MKRTTLILLVLILLLTILSWLGSVYGWGVHNVLSEDGLRWAASSLLDNFRQAPLAEILMVGVTVSLLSESGLHRSFSRHAPLKQRRALQLSLLVLLLGLALLLAAVFLPRSIFLSSFGTFAASPAAHGLLPASLLLIALVSVTYGFTSGRFMTTTDTLAAAAYLPATLAYMLPPLFFLSQFIAEFAYVFSAHPTLSQLRPSSPLAALLYVCLLVPPVVRVYGKR